MAADSSAAAAPSTHVARHHAAFLVLGISQQCLHRGCSKANLNLNWIFVLTLQNICAQSNTHRATMHSSVSRQHCYGSSMWYVPTALTAGKLDCCTNIAGTNARIAHEPLPQEGERLHAKPLLSILSDYLRLKSTGMFCCHHTNVLVSGAIAIVVLSRFVSLLCTLTRA
jgi:hypothetical protein